MAGVTDYIDLPEDTCMSAHVHLHNTVVDAEKLHKKDVRHVFSAGAVHAQCTRAEAMCRTTSFTCELRLETWIDIANFQFQTLKQSI